MASRARETEVRINGISMRAMRKTVEAIRKKSSLGRFQFRARDRWLDGGRTRATVKNFYRADMEQQARVAPLVVDSDGPAVLGGSARAMDPLEQLLAALGASFTTTTIWYAAARDIHVDAVDTWVEGDVDLRGCLGLDPGVPPGFLDIRLSVIVEADATDAQLDELIALASRRSPVLETIGRETRVRVKRERKASEKQPRDSADGPLAGEPTA